MASNANAYEKKVEDDNDMIRRFKRWKAKQTKAPRVAGSTSKK